MKHLIKWAMVFALVLGTTSSHAYAPDPICEDLESVSDTLGHISGVAGVTGGFMTLSGIGATFGVALFGVAVVTYAMQVGVDAAMATGVCST